MIGLPLQVSARSDHAVINGVVIIAGGYTNAGIPVELKVGEVVLRSTITDSLGNFKFEVIRSGTYVLRINENGFLPLEHSVDVSTGPRNVQLFLFSATGSSRRTGAAGSFAPVVDFRQLSIPGKAMSQYDKAMAEIQKERTEPAIDRLKKAVMIAPNFYEAHRQLGLQYFKSGQLEQAEAELSRAAELNGRAAEPLIALGLLYLGTKRHAEAIDVLERGLDLNPTSARGSYYLGLALLKVGMPARAETMFNRALQLEPTHHVIRLGLADLYLHAGRHGEALRELELYLLKDPRGSRSAIASQVRDRLMEQTSD
jgi:tetratricopeptide (TPR) repeat protein